MTKPWKKKPEITEPDYCRCPPSHNMAEHDEKGCTRSVVIFRCRLVGHIHKEEDCWTLVPCRCHIKNIPDVKVKTIGQSIAEAEKVTV